MNRDLVLMMPAVGTTVSELEEMGKLARMIAATPGCPAP
jgi:hypothetical protein